MLITFIYLFVCVLTHMCQGVCVCVCVCVGQRTTYGKSVVFFHHVGPGMEFRLLGLAASTFTR